MSSLFGGSKPNAPFGSTTSFGNTNNNQNAAPSIFGTGTQQPNTAPGPFGANAGNSGNPSGNAGALNLFGSNPPANNPSPFSQLNNTGAGATAPTGTFFGGPLTNAPPTGFGNTIPGANLSGGTNMSTNNTGTGLFGNNPNANAAQPSTSGGLFANLNQSNSAGGGLFGNPSGSNAPNTNTGGGSFGQMNNGGGSTSNMGLFGGTTGNNPTNASYFGGNTTNNPPNTGLFGNNPNNNSTNTGLFGNNTTNNPTNPGLFGGNTTNNPNFPGGSTTFPLNWQQTAQQTQPSQPATLFGPSTSNQTGNQTQPFFGGQNSTNKLGSGLFSSSAFGPQPATASLFGPRSSSLQTSTSLSATPQLDLQQRIESIAAAWDPTNPQCRFQHYFYNMVDPNQVGLYTRSPNATNDALWNQAVRENPDPKCMVPVLALGFDDLQKRVDAQSTQAKQHTEKLKELQARLTALAQTHVLSTSRNTTRVLQTRTLITHRLLRLAEHVHLLIPNLRSAAISPEEEGLRANLERLREELSSGNGRGRLNELWALLGAVKAARERGGGFEGTEWKVVDWDGLEKLATILAEQQQGLAHLTSVINNGLRDLQIMGDGGHSSRPESANSNYIPSMLGHLR